MLYYDRIDRSEGIDPTKSNKSRECMISHYWFFNHRFKFADHVCNDCHNLRHIYMYIYTLCLNISHIAIITVDYRCIMYNINKSEAINLLEKNLCSRIVGIYQGILSIQNIF